MKRRSIIISLITIASLVVLSESCKHTPIDFIEDIVETPDIIDTTGGPDTIEYSNCDPDTVYFENDIFPILISNCAISGCHDNESHEEGINLSSYVKVMSSDIIDISDPWDSELIEKATENDADDIMPPPPMSPLTDAEIEMIVLWMEQGAKNNSCTDCDTTEVTFAAVIMPILDAYCSGCHDNTSPSGSIDLTSYLGTGSNEGIYDVASDGRLFGAINQDYGFEPMPPGGTRLPDCLIDQIRIWVEDGYPDN